MSPQKPAQHSKKGSEVRRPSKQGGSPSERKRAASESVSVRSVLIEPRETEPPRVSVSVEYESEAPSLKALQKAAMETIHGVVRREGKLEDLGYRHQQRSRELVQMFECREKGEADG